MALGGRRDQRALSHRRLWRSDPAGPLFDSRGGCHIDIIKKELPVDLLESFVLTPLPGSEDRKNLHARRLPKGLCLWPNAIRVYE